MAGDWIKMRTDLSDDPAVVSIAGAIGTSEDEVVGKLHRLWSWADRHTTDGRAPAITAAWVDRYVSAKGFADAMVAMEWLKITDDGIQFPSFDKHNGQSAKRRVEAAVRQRLSRAQRDNGVTGVGLEAMPRPFIRAVMDRDGYRCVYCGAESSREREASRKSLLSIDHIIPATRGGKSVVANLAACCKLCNREKNDRTPEEWGVLPEFLSAGVTYVSQQICDERATREEKRTEENKGVTPLKPPGDFARWWSAVHSKTGREAAAKAYDKAVKRIRSEQPDLDPHAFLLERMAVFAMSTSANPTDRSPIHPATWLNQGRYYDDPATWNRGARGSPVRSGMKTGPSHVYDPNSETRDEI